MRKVLFFLEKYLGAALIYLLSITLRYIVIGNKPEGRVVFSFWHRDQIPLLYFRRNEGITILISSSKDGELIAGPAKVLGFNTVRGSSRRKAVTALRQLREVAEKYTLAITPDGPKGPNMVIKDGVLFASYMTHLPIVPVLVEIEKEWLFNTWDKFRFPKPFSRVVVAYGDPIYIETKEEIVEKHSQVQKAMDDSKKKAETELLKYRKSC